MNESLENTNSNLFQDSVEKISSKYNFIKNENDLLFYCFEESKAYGWEVEEFKNNTLLISKSNSSDLKENLVICLPISKFNNINIANEDLKINLKDNISILDNQLICKGNNICIKNIVNSSIFLNILDNYTETNNLLEKLNEFYNIKILLFEESDFLPSNILKKLNYNKILLLLNEDSETSLQICQEKIQPFEIEKQINFEDSILENYYSIETKVLYGTQDRCSYEKEQLNPLRFNFEILDILKNKFDIEVLDINNTANLNERSYSSKIKISSNQTSIQNLLEEIRNYHINLIDILQDLNVNISIQLNKEYNNSTMKKISSKSIEDIKDLSLFLILKIFDNNIDNQNSINISTSKFDNITNMFTLNGIIQSSNNNTLNQMKKLLSLKTTELECSLIFKNQIPLNSVNKKDILRKKAIIAYKNSNHKKNNLFTINNSTQISQFTNEDICNYAIIYSYKINKQISKEIISTNALNKTYEWINEFLSELL